MLRLLTSYTDFYSYSVFYYAYSLRMTTLGLDGLCGDSVEYKLRRGLSLYKGLVQSVDIC